MKNNIIKILLAVTFIVISSSFANIDFGLFGSFGEAKDLDENLIG